MQITSEDVEKFEKKKKKAIEFVSEHRFWFGYAFGAIVGGTCMRRQLMKALKRSLPSAFRAAQLEGAIGLYDWAVKKVPDIKRLAEEAAGSGEILSTIHSPVQLTQHYLTGKWD